MANGTYVSATLSELLLQDKLLAAGVNNVHVEVFEQLPSTNVHVLETIRAWQTADAQSSVGGALPEPWLCITNEQTQGSGRRGKSWHTQAGDITMSYLCNVAKLPSELLGLSLVTGISVANALEQSCDIDVAIKWPNDLLVNGQKLCGLLTELVDNRKAASSFVVSGIGINYQPWQSDNNHLLQANSLPVTSLQNLLGENTPNRHSIVACVIAELQHNYRQFVDHGWGSFAQQWQSRDFLHGKSVTILNGEHREQAIAQGVDEQGALLVRSGGGVKSIYSGDVSVRVS